MALIEKLHYLKTIKKIKKSDENAKNLSQKGNKLKKDAKRSGE
jgi:hypothetical protein